MFTGIVECTGLIENIEIKGSNRLFIIKSPFSGDLRIDQSVAHDGVCLTVEAVVQGSHQVTAIDETLKKSSLSSWKKGQSVNLERSLMLNSRLDGHFVQGHVDSTGVIRKISNEAGSQVLTVEYPKEFASLMIEKGSICLNGVSLTLFNVTSDRFSVAIIPFTWKHTNLSSLQTNQEVNLEYDMIGKYIVRQLSLDKKQD